MDFSEKVISLALRTIDPDAAAEIIISTVLDFLEQLQRRDKSDELYAIAKAIKGVTQ